MSQSHRILRSQTAANTTSRIPLPPSRIPAPTSSRLATTETVTRLYSDVTASRSPTPERVATPPGPITVTETPVDAAVDAIRPLTDVDSNTSEDSDNGEVSWTTVRRRGRAQSLDSVKKSLHNKKLMYLPRTLSTDKEETVNAAVSLLTTEQKEQVQRRQDKVATQNETSN